MHWRHLAKCRDANTDEFFPDTKATKRIWDLKNKYCRKCPVRQQCFDYAVETDSEGIFGGTTKPERDRIVIMNQILSRFDNVSITSVRSGSNYASQLSSTYHEPGHPSDEHPWLHVHISSLEIRTQPALLMVAEVQNQFQEQSIDILEHRIPEMQETHSDQNHRPWLSLDLRGMFPQQSNLTYRNQNSVRV